jgi:Bacterial SH3 domain
MRPNVALIALAALSSGCSAGFWQQSDQSAQQRQADARRRPEETARKQLAANRELEERIARQQLAIFEKDAELRALNQKLEAAILEVVRAMAKLRGLSGRAEAASSLAETEIALKSVPADAALRPKDADLAQAQQLFALATEEFKKQNYDGTVYLTSQVKLLVKTHPERNPKTAEEVGLGMWLALRAAGRGNVREGPGPSHRVLFVVDKGTPLTAVSYNGVWVRVKTDDGRLGWLHYTLLDQR